MKPSLQTIETRTAWYALRVESQKELRCAKILRDSGISATVPYEQKYRGINRYRKGRKLKSFPLMWGYVLVRLERPVNWLKLFEDFSFLRSVVSVEHVPVALDGAQVDAFLSRADRKHFVDSPLVRNMRTHCEYSVGDDVILDNDAFHGLRGRVVDLTEDDAKILIQFLGAERAVTIPVGEAVKAA